MPRVKKLPAGKSVSKTTRLEGKFQKILPAGTALVSHTMTDFLKCTLLEPTKGLAVRYLASNPGCWKTGARFTNAIKISKPRSSGNCGTQMTGDFCHLPKVPGIFGWCFPYHHCAGGSPNYLPFEALGKGNYLLEQYTIHYSFSGALLTIKPIQQNPQSPPCWQWPLCLQIDAPSTLTLYRTLCSNGKKDRASRAFSLQGDY